MAGKTFRPTDIAGLRAVAKDLGVAMSAGRGAPPIVRLITTAAEKGHTLDLSGYKPKRAEHGKGRIKVTAKVNGKGKLRSATVTVGEVREFAGKTNQRGRTSQNDVVATAAARWNVDVDVLTDVTVTPVDSKGKATADAKAVKVASKPAETVSVSNDTDTPDEDSKPVEANADTVSDESAE